MKTKMGYTANPDLEGPNKWFYSIPRCMVMLASHCTHKLQPYFSVVHLFYFIVF